jgi:DNA-directed RNA polymerase subunit alpha
MAVDPIVTKNWRDLIKPRGLTVDQESLSNTYGKFVAEPLERGFGITLGQLAPPRAPLVAAGRGDHRGEDRGALHEFTTIPDVVEDVTDIILNLKEVVLKAHTNETYTLRIDGGPRARHSRATSRSPTDQVRS